MINEQSMSKPPPTIGVCMYTNYQRLPSILEVINLLSNGEKSKSESPIRFPAIQQGVLHERNTLKYNISVQTSFHSPSNSLGGDDDANSGLPSPRDPMAREMPEYYCREPQAFKFPPTSAGETTPTTSEKSISHVKSSSLSVADEEQQADEEQLILDMQKAVSLTKGIKQRLDVIELRFNAFLDSLRRQETNKEHAIDSERTEQVVKKEMVREFIHSIPIYDFDSLLFDLKDDAKTIKKLKQYQISTFNKSRTIESLPTPQSKGRPVRSDELPQDVSSPSKRARSDLKAIAKRQKSLSSISGDILPLKVNKQTLETRAHMSPAKKNYLNKNFSVKKDKQCFQCSSKVTPEWRKGPGGPGTLCNACGLFYQKLVAKSGEFKAKEIMMFRKNNDDATNRKIN